MRCGGSSRANVGDGMTDALGRAAAPVSLKAIDPPIALLLPNLLCNIGRVETGKVS